MIQKRLPVETYVKGVLKNDKAILGRTITLIESNKPQDQELSLSIMENLMPHTGNSLRMGITGIPGVGKSTFIEEFGSFLAEKDQQKIAVLAIDPSSQLSKGSILGDKTRMEKLAVHPNAFIRPTPSSFTPGGVASKTREVMLLCEAAGYEVIIVETVGVGQSETAVKDMVDFFLLLMIAGAGDDLQGIKRGIMELADLVAINKADGENIEKAEEARKQLTMALDLFPVADSGWKPQVITCSALHGSGMDQIWEQVNNYTSQTKRSGYFQQNRMSQNIHWMHEYILHNLSQNFFQQKGIREKITEMENEVKEGRISPQQAGRILLDLGN